MPYGVSEFYGKKKKKKKKKNKDKYKAALMMMRALRKDPDVISRGLTKARIQSIAADHFGLNHREFAKILNRQTRYESIDEEYITEGKTSASTYFEQVIVACANAKDLDAVKSAPGYAEWIGAVDRKWKTDDKTLDNFRKQIQKISKSGSQAGQSYEKTSKLWKTYTGKSSDTSKADVMLGKHQVSVKGPDARLMSGVKEESIATLHAAFETIDVKDLGLGLEKILNDFVSLVKTEGAEMNSRTLKKQDPKTLSADNKKAFNNLQKQMDVKKLAEAAFNKAFAAQNGEFAQAFAWEAMSGEKKFVNKGVANAMLVWPYNLRSVVWHPNLSLNNSYVTNVAKQIKFSANVKSGGIRKKIHRVKTKT